MTQKPVLASESKTNSRRCNPRRPQYGAGLSVATVSPCWASIPRGRVRRLVTVGGFAAGVVPMRR